VGVSKQAFLYWSVCIKNKALIIDAREALKSAVIETSNRLTIVETDIEVGKAFPLTLFKIIDGGSLVITDDKTVKDSLDPYSLDGLGTITPESGAEYFLALVQIHHYITHAIPNAKFELGISNDNGALIDFSDFTQLFETQHYMSWDEDTFRESAEALGLIRKIVNLKKLDSNVEDMYF